MSTAAKWVLDDATRATHRGNGIASLRWNPCGVGSPAADRPPIRQTWRTLAGTDTWGTQLEIDERRSTFKFEWLAQALTLGPDDYDIDVLSDIISEIDRSISIGRIDQLQHAIKLLPLRRLSAEVLVTVLRAAAPARQTIAESNWRELVQDVQRCLDERGLDGRSVLRGLT